MLRINLLLTGNLQENIFGKSEDGRAQFIDYRLQIQELLITNSKITDYEFKNYRLQIQKLQITN